MASQDAHRQWRQRCRLIIGTRFKPAISIPQLVPLLNSNARRRRCSFKRSYFLSGGEEFTSRLCFGARSESVGFHSALPVLAEPCLCVGAWASMRMSAGSPRTLEIRGRAAKPSPQESVLGERSSRWHAEIEAKIEAELMGNSR
jgi:hypothetical protein